MLAAKRHTPFKRNFLFHFKSRAEIKVLAVKDTTERVHQFAHDYRNLDAAFQESHNAPMDLDILMLGFLQGVAMGAGMVFALFLAVRLSMPRRSAVVVIRRTESDGCN
jgi:hypothetical protein